MRIQSILIRGLRSFDDSENSISLDDFTVLVGRNSAGKSTILRALGFFYDPAARVDEKDFHGGWKQGREIQIAVTFCDLSADEVSDFGRHAQESRLNVMKVFRGPGAPGEYYGFRPQVPAFAALRANTGKAFNDLYKELRGKFGLGAARSEAEGRAALDAYEQEHPSECSPEREPRQFFGPSNVGGGKLDNYTGFIFVPAVRDAIEVSDGKDGPIATLITRILLPGIENKEQVKKLKESVDKEITSILEGSNADDLPRISASITELLRLYAPDAALTLRWGELVPTRIAFPSVNRSVLDDGWDSPVAKVGHGLQRSLIIALLQYQQEMARRQEGGASNVAAGAPPTAPSGVPRSVIFAIEEPELYLHPSRCRHLASVLFDLATRGSRDFQVICATHSPFFLSLARFPSVRIVRKIPCTDVTTGGPRRSSVRACDADAAAKELAALLGEDPHAATGPKLLADLGKVLHPNPALTEGFFADFAVLVEGETDVGVLTEMARSVGARWDERGVVVIPCAGKNKMSRPALIYRRLGIPTFLVFDGDRRGKDQAGSVRDNRVLQRLCGEPKPVEWPATSVSATLPYAAFEETIESHLEAVLGEEYRRTLTSVADELGLDVGRAIKSREAAARVVRDVCDAAREKLVFLRQLVERISALAGAAAKA